MKYRLYDQIFYACHISGTIISAPKRCFNLYWTKLFYFLQLQCLHRREDNKYLSLPLVIVIWGDRKFSIEIMSPGDLMFMFKQDFSCLGHLRWNDTNINYPSCVVVPKEANSSKVAQLHIDFADIFARKLCLWNNSLRKRFWRGLVTWKVKVPKWTDRCEHKSRRPFWAATVCPSWVRRSTSTSGSTSGSGCCTSPRSSPARCPDRSLAPLKT